MPDGESHAPWVHEPIGKKGGGRVASHHERLARYSEISRLATQLDSADFRAIVEQASGAGGSWGQTHTVALGGYPVFVKRIPLTAVERAHACSTENLYNLPASYHYGVDSAGFGVYRELAAHRATTRWVLNGDVSGFPLLYHHRVIPAEGTQAEVWPPDRLDRYTAYWGGHPGITRYVADRASATYEMVLLLEHFPKTLSEWLLTQTGETSRVLADLRTTAGFLREHGILHFDPHFDNVVTDGNNLYLTDFGLVLDRGFALDGAERTLFASHQLYDFGVMLLSLMKPLLTLWRALPDGTAAKWRERHGMQGGASDREVAPLLLDHVEELTREGFLALDRDFVENLRRHHDAIAVMGDFFTALIRNPRKDTPFPDGPLRDALGRSGFLRD